MKAINLGGVGGDRTAVGIAELIAPRIRQHWLEGRHHVVVVIDREGRDVCCPQFAQDITEATHREFARKGASEERFVVVIADRALEAWILADAEGLHARRVFRNPPRFRSFEGSMGKRNALGKVEIGELLGREYSERRDGPAVLSEVEIAAARDHGQGRRGSRSFQKFLTALDS